MLGATPNILSEEKCGGEGEGVEEAGGVIPGVEAHFERSRLGKLLAER